MLGYKGKGGQEQQNYTVTAVAQAAGDVSGANWSSSSAEVLPAVTRTALMQAVDAAWVATHGEHRQQNAPHPHPHSQQQQRQREWSKLAEDIAARATEDDFKVVLSPPALTALIGARAFQQLNGILQGKAGAAAGVGNAPLPDAIAIRRTVATGKWIKWHTDAAGRTLCVPLSDANDCIGGQLLFAGVGKAEVVAPLRTPGGWIVHDGDMAHGVTKLVQGTRYGLFLLKARTAGVRILDS